MIREAIDRLLELSAPEWSGGEGSLDYVSRPVFLPPKEPIAETLPLSSLASLVAYLAENRDGHDLATLTILVRSPWKVELLGKITGRHRQRETLAAVDYPAAKIDGKNIPLDQFRMMLGSQCEDCEGRVSVLDLSKRLTVESTEIHEDEGLAQRVTVSAGVKLREMVKTVNPLTLRPFVRFPEVGPQPEREYLLRFHEGPTASLTACDGEGWVLPAKTEVQSYLTNLLGSAKVEVPVLA